MSASSNPGTPLSRRYPELEEGLDGLFAHAIGERTFPGASLLVAGPEGLLLEGAWGRTHYEGGTAVGPRTYFDLASLTKPLITATLYLWAVGNGHLHLDAPLNRLIPATLVPEEKADIRLIQLLNHCSGLPAYQPFYRDLILVPESRRRETLLSWILQTPLESSPGKRCRYSDLGFMLLGLLLEELFGSPLDTLASRWVLSPLGIGSLAYRRLETVLLPTVEPLIQNHGREGAFAPTEECPWRRRLLVGEVHDENAYCLSGVAGHAGVFGTSRAIFELLSHLLDVYRNGVRGSVLRREYLRLFWEKPAFDPDGTWALGFDTPSRSGSSAGRHFSGRSIGHLGFTGVSFWMDLERAIIVILLTNRVHPTRENDRIRAFRPLVHDRVMKGLHDI